jgi:hypothetical protein
MNDEQRQEVAIEKTFAAIDKRLKVIEGRLELLKGWGEGLEAESDRMKAKLVEVAATLLKRYDDNLIRICRIEERLRAIDDFDADFCDTVQERLECLEHQISQSPHVWVQTSFGQAAKDEEEPKS